MDKEYIGTDFEGTGPGTVIVQPSGHELDTGYDNERLPSHSPDGFQCGYIGSGPTQLAAALLYDVSGDPATAIYLKRDFTHTIVADLPNDRSDEDGVNWRLKAATVREWIELNDDR